jgi:hypothetical protein
MTEQEIAWEFNRKLGASFDREMARLDKEMWFRDELKDRRAMRLLFHPPQPVEDLPLFRWARMMERWFVIEEKMEGSRTL